MKACGDSLCQLAQLLALQGFTKLRLADQKYLQQLVGVGFQIGEHANLLQHIGSQVLCLVDHQNGALPFRVGLQQVVVEPVQEHFERGLVGGEFDTELVTDRLQQFRGGQRRIENQRDVHLFRQLLEKCTADGRLAGAHFTRQEYKPATLPNSVEQMCQCFTVLPAEIQVVGVRCNGKHRLPQSEIFLVNGHSVTVRECVPHRLTQHCGSKDPGRWYYR